MITKMITKVFFKIQVTSCVKYMYKSYTSDKAITVINIKWYTAKCATYDIMWYTTKCATYDIM